MKPGTPRLTDAADRRQAVTLFDRNIVVTAGAGTGKTALLVERALNLIGSGRSEIGSMALITFTEKAAAELRQRLASGLDRLRRLAALRTPVEEIDPETDASRSYAWLCGVSGQAHEEVAVRALQALTEVDTAAVDTIHAFCAEVLRRYPREAGVDPNFGIDEGPIFERLFEAEWERFLAAELGASARRAELWQRALRQPGALEIVRDLGMKLASFSFPAELFSDRAPGAAPDAVAMFRADAEEIRRAIGEIFGRETGMAGKITNYLRSAEALLARFIDSGVDAMQRAEGPFSLVEFVGMTVPDTGKKPTDDDRRLIRQVARRARGLINGLTTVDEQTLAVLIEAAKPLAAGCRERLLSEGFVSFAALLSLTRDLLAENPTVRRDLGRRYPVLLVDEFQDTDPLQYEILFFIAGEEPDGVDDPWRLVPRPGSLFIVGDPKQSIYRFRGADFDAYRRAVDHLLSSGGKSLSLTASFRSPEGIIAPINRLFGSLMGRTGSVDPRFEPGYEEIAAARREASTAGEEPRFEIWSVTGDGNATARRRAEAGAIAAWIGLRREETGDAGGALAYRDVALLLRVLTNAGIYAQALRQAGIPYVIEGGRDFYERSEVGDMISFLKAASCPHDGTAMLAVLRSSLGGVPDEELARFVSSGGRLDRAVVPAEEKERFPNLARTLTLIETFRSRLPGRSPDDVIRAALDETPLALLHASTYDGAQRLANLRKLAGRAEGLARQGLSLEETLRALEEEFGGGRTEGDSPLADEEIDAVRILSIHKAKGLEYPVVFLPDVGREEHKRSATDTEAVPVRHDGVTLIGARTPGNKMNYAWLLHQELSLRHEKAEEKRVFYVGCTRARERLILVNSNPAKHAPWRDALGSLGYTVEAGYPADGNLTPGVRHRLVAGLAPRGLETAAEIDPLWARAAAQFRSVAEQALRSAEPPLHRPADAERWHDPDDLEGSAGDARPDARPGVDGVGREVARLAGSAVHAALEHWGFDGAEPLRSLARRAAQRVIESTPDATDAPDLAARVTGEVQEIVEQFIASPLPERLAGVTVLGREVPILFKDEDDRIWNGSCDLVYRDGEGPVVVADYKTERLDGDAAAAAERHRPQMAIYVAALRRAMPGRKVRGELIFVRGGVVVPLD